MLDGAFFSILLILRLLWTGARSRSNVHGERAARVRGRLGVRRTLSTRYSTLTMTDEAPIALSTGDGGAPDVPPGEAAKERAVEDVDVAV